MAFKKPTVKKIEADISKLSVYLRSVKKFGKTTAFRDLILAKYGDPEKGLLVEVGHEYGDSLMDNVNSTHVDTYKDLIELKNWLIKEKGNEHDIRIIAFDVVDEIVPIFETECVRLSNVENPNKKVKSVLGAFGGYGAGQTMTAKLMKEYFTELKKAGFGIFTVAHTRMKGIKEKGTIEDESYQMLTSNLQSQYEAVFGDLSDIVLTGYIDRNLETVGEGDKAKRYATSEIRKLYFRGTSVIDAGSRFAPDAVPEYIVFDEKDEDGNPCTNGKKLLDTIENGIRKSVSSTSFATAKPTTKPTPAPIPEPIVEEPIIEDDIDDIDTAEEETIEETPEIDVEELRADIRGKFKSCTDKHVKAAVKAKIQEYGKLDDLDLDVLLELKEMFK